jgi:hypothetical protein
MRGVKTAAGFAGVGLVATLVSGCSASVSTKAVGQCSPSYTVSQAGYGRVTAQQAGRGQTIAWGVYVADKYKVGTQFVVSLYAGGVKIDGKNQTYEPHGSVGAAKAAKYSGQLLEISGSGKHGKDTLFFDMKCHIA